MSKPYTIDYLSEHAAEILDEQALSTRLNEWSSQDASDTEINDISFEPLKAGCAAGRMLIENAATHSYDQWITSAQFVSRCKGGRQIFHTFSGEYPNYDEAEADKKFDEARFKLKPPTCRRMNEATEGMACNNCALFGQIKSPYSLASCSKDVAALISENVLVVSPPGFAEVSSGKLYTDRSFDKKYNHLSESGNVSSFFSKLRKATRVERIVYRPGEQRTLLNENNNCVLNKWRAGGVTATPGDCSTILNHFEHLIPDEIERHHVLSYLAHMNQAPGAKIKHVILVIGGQGIGKSAIGRLLARMVGDQHALTIAAGDAENRFKANWSDRQALIIEELMASDKIKFYNEMKTWIAEETMSVEEKYLESTVAATPRGIFAFSNEVNPTRISSDDRRFFVVRTSMKRQPQEYYEKLFAAINGSEAAHFKQYLLDLDISAFCCTAPPPKTKAKLDIIEDTRPPTEAKLEELIASELGVFSRDLVRLENVRPQLREDYLERLPSVSATTAALRSLGACRLETQTKLDDGTKPRLWVIRNHDQWKDCSAEAIKAEMRK